MSAPDARALFLFDRDLRLDDHSALAALSPYGEIVPALAVTGDSCASSARRRSAREAAIDGLATSLAQAGAPLVIRRGSLAATVLGLAREARATAVGWSLAYDAPGLAAQRSLQAELEEAGLTVIATHDALAVPPEETAAARASDEGLGYRAFAPYLATWRRLDVPPVAARPRFARAHGLRGEAPPTSAGPGGAAARAALEAYLAGPALGYATARDVPGDGPTARLSVALGLGTLAARTVRASIAARARDSFLLVEERLSLRAFERALAQRDFFLQLAWFFEDALDAPLQRRMRGFPGAADHPALAAWREGRTGYPFVDAGLRQLAATGWMHPRARLVAASFLCFDLGVDWRVGRDAWDRELEEYDPALAAGNWQWVAGLGADLAQFPRIYNPRKQARAFDPIGTYARRWIAELADRPAAAGAGEPAANRPQLALPLFGDRAYPAPVVDHEAAARAYLRRYAAYVRDQTAAPISSP